MRTVWLRPRKQRSVSAVATSNLESTVEADSHADTFCLGAGTLCVYDYDTPVSVQGYDPSLGAKEYRVISGAIEYIHPALHRGHMSHDHPSGSLHAST